MSGDDQPPAQDHRVTLQEIADASRVHVSTASRALAASRAGTPPASAAAARVVAMAAELRYVPDPLARGLRTRRTHVLGVLVPRLTDIAISTMYEGLDERSSELGYQTFVGNTLDDPAECRRRAEALLGRRVDGLIFGDARTDDHYLDELADRTVPFVLMNRRHAPYTSVTCDDTLGGGLAGQHLVELGHRRIGVLAGPPNASTSIDRTSGCLESLAVHGIRVPPHHVVSCEFSPEGGRGAVMRVMHDGDRPTAIFAVTDIVAMGAIGALRDLGLRVGVDVALIGYNDISLAKELLVPLTSIHAPLAEMGARAAHLLVERLRTTAGDSMPAAEVLLPPRLVVRRSTDPSAGH